MSKTDKRYVRTEQAFHLTAMNLLASSEKLTVTAMARETHVHRKTFYLHYGAVENVLSEIAERLTALLRTCMDEATNEKGFLVCDAFYQSLLYKALEKKQMFEAFAQKNVPQTFFALMEQPLIDELEKRMYPKSVLTKMRLRYAVAQVVLGAFCTFAYWTEKKDITAVELFELLSKMAQAQTEVIYGKKVR